MQEILDKKKEIESKITELHKEEDAYKDAHQSLRKLQGKFEEKNNNLATQKGVCPFPNACRERFYCTEGCNADACDNGFAYRMS
jgi:hypothetical protein